jgi:hypothetical protein
VDDKITEARHKIAAIKLVGLKCPRAAHRLLTCCASKLMSYLSATVPPHIMVPALRTFDSLLISAFLDVLSPTPIVCSEDRMLRAKLKLSLPAPAGCGLLKTASKCAFTWWASVSQSLQDPLLHGLRAGLDRLAPLAWDLMTEALGGSGSKMWLQIKHLLPPTPAGLTDGSLYSPSNANKVTLVSVIHKLLAADDTRSLRELASPSRISQDGRLTASDVIQTSSLSFAGRIFASTLKYNLPFPFGPSNYIAWCLFFLGLPPTSTLFNQEAQPGFDYPVQRCLSKHGVHTVPFLDSAGDHAAASACSARSKTAPSSKQLWRPDSTFASSPQPTTCS